MADWAVIFDVDGVLLELTRGEEDVFFAALSRFVPTRDLSRDWNSYRIRNDDDIIAEILLQQGLPQTLKADVTAHYIAQLSIALENDLKSVPISGAGQLLAGLADQFTLGIATANLYEAAAMRLHHASLWHHVSGNAQGADGGGSKSAILKRLLDRIDLPRSNIIFIGDNLNDLQAGRDNGVHFIGFSSDQHRRQSLRDKGAQHVIAHHQHTAVLLTEMMKL